MAFLNALAQITAHDVTLCRSRWNGLRSQILLQVSIEVLVSANSVNVDKLGAFIYLIRQQVQPAQETELMDPPLGEISTLEYSETRVLTYQPYLIIDHVAQVTGELLLRPVEFRGRLGSIDHAPFYPNL